MKKEKKRLKKNEVEDSNNKQIQTWLETICFILEKWCEEGLIKKKSILLISKIIIGYTYAW
jgi:hypothetical protein